MVEEYDGSGIWLQRATYGGNEMMDVDPVQEFHRAAEQGDIDYVSSVIKAGLDVDCLDHDNNTALHIAAANDHEAVVALLLSCQAESEATNSMGWTPLMQAARHGHMAVVLLLVRAGVSVDARNRLGMTALMLASVSGHMGTIRTLIDVGANYNPASSITPCQVTPLMIAAQHGNDAVVRLYLDKGVNAKQATPKTGITPLMFSAAGGNLSTAQILLDRGADPNSLSASHLTALDVAEACNRPDISSCLQKRTTHQKKGSQCDIMEASRRGDVQAVQEILMSDPSQCLTPNADGATPLMVTAMMGHIQVAQVLLQYGAHVDAQDFRNGWTALMQAIYHRQTEMAKFLVQCGADMNKVTHRGYTAFDFASEMLDTDIMRIFIEAQMSTLGNMGNISPCPQPAWSHNTGASTDCPEGTSKLGLKHWWNRVSNKFHKVRGMKAVKVNSPEPESIGELGQVSPLTPIHYDPILPQEVRLPPIMDFGAGSAYVLETMRSMVPPHISPTGFKPTAMPPGRKILPGGPLEPPRHATNSRLLKWSLVSSVSPGSSLSAPSPQSSGEARGLGSMLKSGGTKIIAESGRSMKKDRGGGERELLVLSMDSGDSGPSSLKTVTSSKSSKSSRSSRSTSTLIAEREGEERRERRGHGESGEGGPEYLRGGSGGSDGKVSEKIGTKRPEKGMSTLPPLDLSTDGGLAGVLIKLGLSKYLGVFEEQEVDLEVLLELTDGDLCDLGISDATVRSTIMAATVMLRSKLQS
ncbi:hypothetical protein Pmani_007552 [Petrolisthes manimaculis]|uniref:SAM domain-containing protein n=1 Tax=Petrolisthes manimaculis TaxID=1843537 RepID=A0AAE1Q8D2_9EUCA|nr:hypothetical protein Pmani_007552 [Petrolisthes manimaculis]